MSAKAPTGRSCEGCGYGEWEKRRAARRVDCEVVPRVAPVQLPDAAARRSCWNDVTLAVGGVYGCGVSACGLRVPRTERFLDKLRRAAEMTIRVDEGRGVRGGGGGSVRWDDWREEA